MISESRVDSAPAGQLLRHGAGGRQHGTIKIASGGGQRRMRRRGPLKFFEARDCNIFRHINNSAFRHSIRPKSGRLLSDKSESRFDGGV
ncbi:MAG: hypothetical protein KTR19_06925 [Hyphomicrobiales bacterium]|nr:hypothetical protein [Hyphomicrobiales bacterium]